MDLISSNIALDWKSVTTALERWQRTIVRTVQPLPPLLCSCLCNKTRITALPAEMFLQTRNAFEIDLSLDNNHIKQKIIGDFQQASNDSFCAGKFPTYLSHLYIKEWKLTSWNRQTHTKARLVQQFKVSNSVIVLHLKSLRISYQSLYFRNSIVLRVCIWFVLWTPLIVYQVFKLKQTSL